MRSVRRALGVGAVLVLWSALVSWGLAFAQPAGFADVVEGAYYSEPVASLVARGVFAGTECEEGFCPAEPIDRKTMAVWTVRVLDGEEPEAVTETRFGDVDADGFHAPFIERMAELRVTAGCADGAVLRFCPDRTVSRAQMAVFLARAFELPEGPDPGFADVPDEAWYAAEVTRLAASEITVGCSDGAVRWFCPDRDTTRAQMATFLYRAEKRRIAEESSDETDDGGSGGGGGLGGGGGGFGGGGGSGGSGGGGGGGGSDSEVNDPPAFTSPGQFTVQENTTLVGHVRANDPDPSDSVTGYGISGGVDGSHFTVGNSGELRFVLPPDHERPADTGSDNQYELQVSASGGAGSRESSQSQTILVVVTDSAEPPAQPNPPVLILRGSDSLQWGWDPPANTGPDIDSYELEHRPAAGAHPWQTSTHVTSSATLTSLTADTQYTVRVRAHNSEGYSPWSEPLVETTSAVVNRDPAFSGPTSLAATENELFEAQIRANDPDAQDAVSFSISGGADSALFEITGDGTLYLMVVPDYEQPADTDGDNVYHVEITADSGTGSRLRSISQAFAATVGNAGSEPPAAPLGPLLVSRTATSLEIVWPAPFNPGPTITGYQVFFRRHGAGGGHAIWHPGTGRTATLDDLAAGTAYEVEVRAANADGYGELSHSPIRFESVSVSQRHACGLTTDGAAHCWGSDEHGETTTPTGTFTAVTTGPDHSCGLRPDGAVVCWGSDRDGQSTPPQATFASVSAGGAHTCGVTGDGTVECWGSNATDQATAPDGTFVSVSAGNEHTCGVTEDGAVECWGRNSQGQANPPSSTFTSVSAGDTHTCGITAGGTVACWGLREDGRTVAPAGTATALSVGYEHACAVMSDETVQCWGRNNFHQAAPRAGRYREIGAGRSQSCGVSVLGAVECWGTGPLATPTQKTVLETAPSTAPDPATAAPAAAQRLWVSSGNGLLDVRWEFSDQDGSNSPTGYMVQWRTQTQEYNTIDDYDSAEPVDRQFLVSSQTAAHTITGLTNSQRYLVRVVAVNAVGNSPSEEVATRAGVPGWAEANVRITLESRDPLRSIETSQLRVTMQAPSDHGRDYSTGNTNLYAYNFIIGQGSNVIRTGTLLSKRPQAELVLRNIDPFESYYANVVASFVSGGQRVLYSDPVTRHASEPAYKLIAKIDDVVADYESDSGWLRAAWDHVVAQNVKLTDLPGGTRGQVRNDLVWPDPDRPGVLPASNANTLLIDTRLDLESQRAAYVIVHELAHVHTLTSSLHDADPSPLGIAWLYFETRFGYAYGQQASCLPTEVMADAMAWDVDSSLASTMVYLSACPEIGGPPDAAMQAVIDSLVAGLRPAWFDTEYDTGTKAWAEVKSQPYTQRMMLVRLLRNEFGGYCSVQKAMTSAFFGGTDPEPFKDGGC